MPAALFGPSHSWMNHWRMGRSCQDWLWFIRMTLGIEGGLPSFPKQTAPRHLEYFMGLSTKDGRQQEPESQPNALISWVFFSNLLILRNRIMIIIVGKGSLWLGNELSLKRAKSTFYLWTYSVSLKNELGDRMTEKYTVPVLTNFPLQ